ncbi:pseudouridine synthase [Haematococcus lacustris]
MNAGACSHRFSRPKLATVAARSPTNLTVAANHSQSRRNTNMSSTSQTAPPRTAVLPATVLQAELIPWVGVQAGAGSSANGPAPAMQVQDSRRRAQQWQRKTKSGHQPQPPHMVLKGGQQVEEADDPIQPHHFITVDNLQLVLPYYYDFKCYVKQRWAGKCIVDLFAQAPPSVTQAPPNVTQAPPCVTQEFPLLTPEYYTRAFAAGRLRVEGNQGGTLRACDVTLDTPLQVGWCIRHFIHRHEPPVLAGRVQLLGQTEDFVAVCKPACMPVHTVGQFRKNTLLGVMQAQYPELGQLYPTFSDGGCRLDKPVSGLLLLARSSEAAGRMRQHLEPCTQLASSSVQVEVLGAPHGHTLEAPPHTLHAVLELDVALSWDPKTNHVTAESDGPQVGGALSWAPELTANAGDTVSQPAPAANVPPVSPTSSGTGNAKPAATQFQLIRYDADSDTSIVECRPLTGRTHQIRVHLQFPLSLSQYLGYPIANDSQYGGSWGAPLAFRRLRDPPSSAPALDLAAGGYPAPSSAATGISRPLSPPDPPQAPPQSSAAGGCLVPAALDMALLSGAVQRLYTQPEFRVQRELVDEVCPHCPCLAPRGYPIDLQPLWLHALRYSSLDWAFEAPWPEWAAADYCCQRPVQAS